MLPLTMPTHRYPPLSPETKTGKRVSFIFLVLLNFHFAFVADAAMAATADSATRISRKPSSPKELHSLIDQEGHPFSFAGLANKTVLLNFIFTSCALSCPAQTQALVGIQRALTPAL